MRSGDSTSLAPGFRFHPTDEELVSYYLKRKITGKNFQFDAIAEIDVYRVEPWDISGFSKLKSRDLEWYFFSALDKKYGNGSRTNRATGEGYWKTTGRDRKVHHRSRVVGMKKTLVYHLGRAPKGKRTNWVMHEYKLIDEVLEKAGASLEGYALCRIFQKSGSGPKNGEKYGAPLAEEEWENDDVETTVPGFEEPFADDNEYTEKSEHGQGLDTKLAGNVRPVPNYFHHEDNGIHFENPVDASASEKYFARENEDKVDLQVMDDQLFSDLPDLILNTTDIVRNEVSSDNFVNCLSYEPLADNVSNSDIFDDGFLDALDFLDHAKENPLDFDIPDIFMDDDIDIGQYLGVDAPPLMSNDTFESFSAIENFNSGTRQIPTASQQQHGLYSVSMATSTSTSTSKASKSAIQYPCLSQASRLLGNIPAPPAFASEFPSKDMAARLSAASSLVHVTAGMIRMKDSVTAGSRLQWSMDKIGNVSVFLSFDLPGDANESGLSSLLTSKMAAAFSWRWLRSMLCVIAFSVSFKFGSFIFAQ